MEQNFSDKPNSWLPYHKTGSQGHEVRGIESDAENTEKIITHQLLWRYEYEWCVCVCVQWRMQDFLKGGSVTVSHAKHAQKFRSHTHF